MMWAWLQVGGLLHNDCRLHKRVNCAMIRKRTGGRKGKTKRPTLRGNRVGRPRIKRLPIIARNGMRCCRNIFPGHSRTSFNRQAGGTEGKGAATICNYHNRLCIACLSSSRSRSTGSTCCRCRSSCAGGFSSTCSQKHESAQRHQAEQGKSQMFPRRHNSCNH